jgi:exopolysaccharide biosynthesis polyprenyl glycosylphosphotransferase
MSSTLPTPRPQKPKAVDWARLIPGEAPSAPGKRKPPQPVRERKFAENVSEISAAGVASRHRSSLALLMPGPLLSRMASRWMRSTTADFALVGLNWLLLGALLVPLRLLFPQVAAFRYAAGAPLSLLGLAVLHAVLITLLGHTEGLYVQHSESRGQTYMLGKSVLWATTVLCFAYSLQGARWTTSGLFCAAGLLHFGALWTWRWQNGKQQRRTGQCCRDVRNVLIVGAGGVGRRVASHLAAHPEGGRTVYGVLDNEGPLGNGVVGRVGDLARMARTGFVDEVILTAPHDRSLTSYVLREARRLRLDVEIVPELFGCEPEGSEFERVGGMPVICLHAERLPAIGLALKRLVDVTGAVFALAALSPLLALISGLIKLDSPGGVLYRAPRAGRKGRMFPCYKFRTMVRNADGLRNNLLRHNERTGPHFKIADDPRITRLGRFLRRYSLDELPQLWNVLKGDMSLVGPRPPLAAEVAEYELGYLGRLDVMPGITGLWQVTARRDPSFLRWMELDREYIQTWSLASDVRILLKTFLAVVQGSGQ